MLFLWGSGDFHVPIAVLILVNLAILFSTVRFLSVFQKKVRSKSTALRKHSISRTDGVFNQGRKRLELYLRLFVIMGESWIFEIVVSTSYFKSKVC